MIQQMYLHVVGYVFIDTDRYHAPYVPSPKTRRTFLISGSLSQTLRVVMVGAPIEAL